MRLDDLRAFLQVAEAGGFSRAAVEHRVAQSALSKRVTRLEAELGVRLVARDGRGIRLTEQGCLLLDRAGAIFAGIGAVTQELKDCADHPKGRVVVGFPPTTAQVLAPLIAADVLQRYPGIDLVIQEGFSGALNDWLIRGDVDLAILYEPGQDGGLGVTPLIREPVQLVSSAAMRRRFPDILGQGPVAMRDLATLPLILPTRNHSIRQLIERQAGTHRVPLRIAFEVNGMRTIKAMVQAGLGCTLFSYAGVYEEVNAGALDLLATQPELGWMLALAESAPAKRSSAVAAVRRSLLDHLRSLRDGGYWSGEFLFR